MCFIELVDYNELMLSSKAGKTEKATTRRGRAKKKADEPAAVAAPVVAAAPAEEVTPAEEIAPATEESTSTEE
jgi:hypothetical protein